MRERLDLTDRSTASGQLITLLAQERGVAAIEQLLLDTAGAGIDAAGAHLGVPGELLGPARSGGQGVLKMTLNSVLRTRRARRIVLGSYQNWFGHRDRGLEHDAIDVLVELSSWAETPDTGGYRQAIDDLVWDAS